MEENGTYAWKPPKNQKFADFKKFKKQITIGLVALLLVIAVSTCFYTVDDKQQAVVTTFGKVTEITDAGLHFKLPYGIQRAHLVDVNVLGQNYRGICNIGNRPTVGDNQGRTIETHILDFDEDIYGLDMSIEFVDKIRDERKFGSMEQLKEQISKDKEFVINP